MEIFIFAWHKMRMEPMVKWIGGATVAILLAIGGATIVGDMIGKKPSQAPDTIAVESMPPEATLANVIPVDEAAISGDFGNNDAAASAVAADLASNAPSTPIRSPNSSAEANAGADFTPSSATQPVPKPKAASQARPAVARSTGAASTPRATIQRTAQKTPKKSNRFVVKRILDIDGPMKYGDWHWDTKGVPPGPIVVTVDLKARVISVFRGGYEIGAAVAMLGTKKHPTPTGTFPILWKQRHNVSEKYNNAPMPWSMFLTRSGIAIHGGSVVENGYASHGCIAIPDELASRLFKIAKKGDKVIITNGATMSMGDSII